MTTRTGSHRQGAAGGTPMRGEVWWIRLDPAAGSELQKRRPCVIIGLDSIGRASMQIVVPITTWKEVYRQRPQLVEPQPTPTNGLANRSVAAADQVRAIDITRCEQKAGSLTADELEEIVAAVALCIGFEP